MIVPINLNINTINVNILNERYNKDNIFFTQSLDKSTMATFGNYDPITDNINIQVPFNANLENLNSVVSHELLHREQNFKSNFNYKKWIINYGKSLNAYISKFNDRVDTDTATQKEFDKITKMRETFRFTNSYELMAYSYQFTKMRKEIGANTVHELISFIDKETIVPANKKLRKYVSKYWEIKEVI